uniref:Ycf1 protein n=1 Tax=Paronychia argentea TaxID=157622 RepID=UPI00218252CA|nr:Ycf1 protein [Paronychia argentea]UVF30415.1 Ycf1 protein [Paronychia argentea]
MIFQSFLLGNLVSLCMKIINSVVVVGLYYGFLTTFSIGPSYLFLLRAQVMEEGEEGTEKKVSATTGFIMGQLMMFISIYYTPLHLALGRPHTITVLALPYLLFHFFWNNHKHFFVYGSTSRNSMRNLSIQCVFLNNLIFQLFNYFILPSSMLARLVNIYMFRCNNKMLFVTSSFVGWLIGHILFMKWVGLVLVWIQQNNSIRSNVLIRSNKYLVSELKNSMARIFSILLFITCVYYLGRMPSPIFTKKLKETLETKESEEETDVEIEKTSETKQEEEGFTEEDPSPSLFSEEKEDPDKIDETEKIRVNGKDKTKDEFHLHLKETCYKNSPTSYSGNQDISKLEILKEENKNLFWFEKPLLSLLFDYKRWNRPTRYIKNNRVENAVRNEMSQYFFYTCQNDGKQRLSFTYPPSLSIFWEMIQRKISLSTTEKFLYDELYNYWIYTNEQKKNNLSNEFANRIAVLDKGLFYIDVLDKKTRLCNDKTKKEYLPKRNDPFLNGSYRGIIKKVFSPNETAVKNWIDGIFINKIHSILRNDYNYHEFEQKKDTFNKIQISTEIGHFMPLMSQFAGESTLNLNGISLLPEEGKILKKFLVDAIIGESLTPKIPKKCIGIKEISKKVPRWSYILLDDLEQEEKQYEEDDAPTDHQIRSRKAKRVVIYTDNEENTDTDYTDEPDEIALIRYSQQSDFRRDIIKGSMRVQRRKIVIWKLFQANIHSPLFLDRVNKSSLFSVKISRLIKGIFKNSRGKKSEFKIYDYTDKEKEKKKEENKKKEFKREEKKRKENARIKIAEAWDRIIFAQIIRGLTLVTQSILRKYVILPFLIVLKNIGRILLFQLPEWSEDFKEWNREMHVKCTYNGVQLSENEFPKNWLKDGIQIKIIYPFCLKPWRRSTIEPLTHRDQMQEEEQNQKEDFCYLTVWGMETELPFGSTRKRPSFFQPILKELHKKFRKFRKKWFQVLKIVKEQILFFLKAPAETKKWIIQNLLLLKQKIKKKLTVNRILVFVLKEESSQIKKEKDSTIINHTIRESSTQTQFSDWINYSDSVAEQKKKDLANRIKAVKNKMENISNEKKKRLQTKNVNFNPTKTHYGITKLDSPKNIGEIVKRRNTRLIRKSIFFFKFVKERIYVDIFLYLINIPRINIEILTKNLIQKSISNNQTNQEQIARKNKKTIHFISLIKKSFFYIINNNSQIFSDLSSLSQAYVFYKLSQVKMFNLYKLKSVLKYRETSLFLKNEIKYYFGIQGINHSELKTKNLQNYGLNQWKNWLNLKKNSQYDLSQIKWSRLLPHKWRNRATEQREVENINFKKNDKWNSYQKDQFLNCKNTKNSENNLWFLPNQEQKFNIKKNYRYDLLSYNFIFYEDKKDSYNYIKPLPIKKNKEFSYNYNTEKKKLIHMEWSIPMTNFFGLNTIMDIDKNIDRKYFDWKILDFSVRNKVDIETWINISTNSNKNTKTEPEQKNYQIVDKINTKDLFYHTIYAEINRSEKKKNLFDWMGMNEEILSRPISNLEFWFFPEFFLLYNAYKMKPWVIPMNLLFSNLNISDNFIEKKTINRKKKTNPFIRSIIPKKKKAFELENRNQDEKELISQGALELDGQENSESLLLNQQKDIEENSLGSDMKNRRKKKRNSTETELDSLLKRYLLFQLKWNNSLNQKIINNIKVYCFLLRLTNPREITISSIERREINMDIMRIQKDSTLSQLINGGILLIEPIRLSVKDDGQFILYQTIGISLVHKSKHQNNKKKYIENENIDNRNRDESIRTHQRVTKNRTKSHFDLLAPETILSTRRRRELRILICLNSRNQKNNALYKNTVSYKGNELKNCSQFCDESKNIGHENNPLIKLKIFLWPNYRLEDLACMNRYWFDTNNGSRFSILRIHMYPRLK